MYKLIKKLLFLFVLLGALSTGIDYARITAGETPVFNKKSYNSKTHVERFRGLFYIAERKVKSSVNEPLVDSSDIKFKVLTFKIDVPRQFKEQTFEFSLETKTQKVRMGDTLYKITYRCCDDIKEIQLLSEDEKLLYLHLVGKYEDNVQLFNDLKLERVEE